MLPNKVKEALSGFEEEIQSQTCIIHKINEVIIYTFSISEQAVLRGK